MTGQRRRVIGVDQSVAGEPPRNIYAHRDCCEARNFTGCVLLRAGMNIGEILAQPAQLALATR